MRQLRWLALTAILSIAGFGKAIASEIKSPNAAVPYLGVNGVFTLDVSVSSSRQDPRNPGRIVFQEMKNFSFYRDLAGKDPIAENCQYVYQGASPDLFYYPKFERSIWDLFELASEDPNCIGFKYVALRSPHGDPVHMHFRYGGETSSFEELLKMSLTPEDKAKINPWWSLYCAEGVTACD